jgi:SNF2 family DNA or RNA helicase
LLASGKPHVRLKDGRVALANAGLASDLEEVLRDCNPRQERGRYQVPPEQRAYLEASLTAWGAASGPATNKPTAADLGTLSDSLRNYQVEGALWLLDLARRKSGGILADEMGLGKTVQMLAVIEARRGPSLVVCPSSLVWNWRSEAKKFLPDLPVLTLEGPDRKARFAEIASARLVVTSYAALRRDVDLYAGLSFSMVVLDEAQHIKNPDSQNAKSACAIRAESRFILTGTPVENSLRDLWSLFEFALPGYLGTRKDFRDRYEGPLESGLHGAIWERLSRRIHPHMLRRRKGDILPELPDKIEQVIEIELNDEQKAAYTQLQVAARAKIDTLREQGGGTARMQALTALLRLRQACCDLRLLGSESAAPSANRVALLELLEEAMDGGHRTLVFSQFTGVLDLIAGDLKDLEIPFARLDGSTRDRQAAVEGFQNNDKIPVFLISLKAGGTGLNLTAADTVIHYDPWWNPAAEAQASDRVHRIGQKNVVNVIKLISKDTVEEKVLRMQISKRELLEATLDADAVIGSLSAGELGALI